MTGRTICLDDFARVEGQGSLELQIQGDQVVSVQLRIFEPPRFFEALLRGRDFAEAPDITSRICGICPIAYLMTSAQAMEQALDLRLPERLRTLRRLLYCGEWIESHALHIVMLHAPDFLGFPDAIAMAREHREMVEAGLALKRAGNQILQRIGGREVHPVNVKVGGFYRLPSKAELQPLVPELQQAHEHALRLLHWASGFQFPPFEREYEFVALRHPSEYPIMDGRIASSAGLDIAVSDFDREFEERQAPYSNALQAIIRRRGSYLVGPLARYALNYDRLPPTVQALARDAGLDAVCRNPFKSILVRLVEVIFACSEALRLVEAYEPDGPSAVPATPRAAIGWSCTEAPRGICVHSYELAADGSIAHARIVPPTSQNQLSMEQDVRAFANVHLVLDDEALRQRCEQLIRSFDPCISCSTHFLKMSAQRA